MLLTVSTGRYPTLTFCGRIKLLLLSRIQALQEGRVKELTLQVPRILQASSRSKRAEGSLYKTPLPAPQGKSFKSHNAIWLAIACVHLQRLTLRRVDKCHPAFFSGLAACTQLSHLTLDGSLGDHPEPEEASALCQLLAGLPALQELCIRDMCAAHFASSPAVLQRITSLTTAYGGEGSWEQLLQSQAASFQRLHTLELDSGLSLPSARALGDCPKLRHLKIGYHRPDQDSCTLDSPPPALETLTFPDNLSLHFVLQHRWLVKVGCPDSCNVPSSACTAWAA